MSDHIQLFNNFPPVSTSQWMDRITADLRGEDFNKKLVWKTDEGFSLLPFYREEDIRDLPAIDSLPGSPPFLRGTASGGSRWLIRQNIVVDDYSEANRKALEILMKGVDVVGFIIREPESVNRGAISTLLNGIHPESTETNFICEGKAKEILRLFISEAEQRGVEKENIKGAFEADPLGRLFLNGKLCISIEAGLDYLADLTRESISLPSFRTIHINGPWLSEAGAGMIEELAFALSMGNEYMSVLNDRNIAPDDAVSKMRFSFSVGSNYFFEIARLRAARFLWSMVSGAYKPVRPENTKMRIHCVTSSQNKKIEDPHVNLLRTQTEAMSAALGGADSITVEPFDKTLKRPDDFSERIARNQLLLLREEAYFDKVTDPAGGSWYIEKLTSLIAGEAWKLFIEVEDQGGFSDALKSGFLHKKIKSHQGEREQKLQQLP